jgi:glycerol-3-phosphate dehydrogenase (NAD(P)+)
LAALNAFTGISTAWRWPIDDTSANPTVGSVDGSGAVSERVSEPTSNRGRSLKVAVVGAGSWGTTVAALASRNAPTTMWARKHTLAEQIDRDHCNGDYLPAFELPGELRATSALDQAVLDADVVVMAVPSAGFRDVLAEAAPLIRPWVPIVSLTKGLQRDTLQRMSEVAEELLPDNPVAVLTGPNLAKEIMAGQPAAAVVAMADDRIASALQKVFVSPVFRVYTNPDVVGCEICGVVKNVMAIAAGMAEGMGFGDNTKATIITRGLAELTRLGVALGGDPMTFSGLAGIGDLIATCMSSQSRNHSVGLRLGRGETIDDIIASTNQVAEGVKSSQTVLALAERVGVEMPLCEQVVAVCHHGLPATDAVRNLMTRSLKRERT